MNRAERRRRGLTRSRMARTGSLASAGVLMSVGLFGAYTGSPRLQRAYASGCTTTNAYVATTDDSLYNALYNSEETCIEIEGTITLRRDLPIINADLWVGSPRESEGLTIFGDPHDDGADVIKEDNSGRVALRMYVDGNQGSAAQDLILNISDLTFVNLTEVGGSGGAIFAYAAGQPHDFRVNLNRVTFTGNEADNYGGAVLLATSGAGSGLYVDVNESHFSYNSVSSALNDVSWRTGGAIHAYALDDTVHVDVMSSSFNKNTVRSAGSGFQGADANAGGGAIGVWSYGGQTAVTVDGASEFTGNRAELDDPEGTTFGGAIYSNRGVHVLGGAPGAIFNGNYAGKGGAIFTYSSVNIEGDTMDSALFSGNEASTSGGAIHADGNVTVGAGAKFDHNMATGGQADGGAIFTASSLTVTGSASHPVVFMDDSASQYGGAVYAKSGADVAGTVFKNNTAWRGGALYNFYGPLSITDSTIENNTALDNAGGIYSMSSASMGGTIVQRSAVVYNRALGSEGGGIYVSGGPLVVENSFIGGNSAGVRGGGISMKNLDNDVDLRFSTMYDDTTSSGQATEIWARNITSTASVVGSSRTGDVWEFSGNLDDSYSVSTSDDTVFVGDGSDNFNPGELKFDAPDGAAPGQWGRTPSGTSPLTAPEPNGLAPLFNPLPGITTDQLGVTRVAPFTIGARQVVPPSPPSPPAPAPSVPASAPRDVRAEEGVESAKVSWLPPSSSGDFPVTTYQAVASPGGQSCMVAAPALTCTITGLTPGKPYTVTARALTGAGWGATSSPSEAVVPLAPSTPTATILITNSRDRAQKSMARIEGTTTGLVGAEVVPFLRMAGQTDFTSGASTRTVDAQGNFVWQRKAKKRFTVYFVSGDVTSNRLVIRPE